MWIDVKTLSSIVGKTCRTIQLMAKSGKITSRKKDGKTLEIYVPSLPGDWQTLVTSSGSLPAVIPARSLAILAPPAQLAAYSTTGAPSILSTSTRLTDRQRQRMLMANKLKQQPSGTTRTAWISAVAAFYGVSVSTVRRISEEMDTYGLAGKPHQERMNSPWDQEAVTFLRAFFLQAIRELGACSKTVAWKKVQQVAQQNAWRIGSRTSAFDLLSDISPLMVAYAKGGSRALDNIFFITRDPSKLRPMQVVIGDQHIFDHWIADYDTGLIRRPECYLWLDMGTKLVYGLAFDQHYSADTVRESIRLGLYRFGRFDCSYNDNGSSECSKAITAMLDDLIRLEMQAQDISELSRTAGGVYIVEDEDGNVVDTAVNVSDWRRKHRRINATVRNAKAKDIERFFRTLNTKLDDKLLPGRCATPASSAAVDEVERARLERQKNNHELLTEAEFIQVVCQAIDEYEHDVHSTLGMSPVDRLGQEIEHGWRPRQISEDDIDLLLGERTMRAVRSGRVEIDGIMYWGDEQRTENGSLLDVGLWSYDKQRVEVRYNRYNRSHAYAMIKGKPRLLEPVKPIGMLDDEALPAALGWKRRQMRAVKEAFAQLVKPIGSVAYRPQRQPSIRQATVEDIEEETDSSFQEAVTKRLEYTRRSVRTIPFLPLHASNYDRYRWCQDMLIQDNRLSEADLDFMRSYERTEEFSDNRTYWENYRKLGGAR